MEKQKIVLIGESREAVSGFAGLLERPHSFVEKQGFGPGKIFEAQPNLIVLFDHKAGDEVDAIAAVIKEVPDFKHVPVLLVIPENGPSGSRALDGFQIDDLITEPIDGGELKVRVRSLLEKRSLFLENQEQKRKMADTREQMKEKVYLMTTLFLVGEKLKESLDPTEIYRAIRETLSGITDVKCFSIYLFDETGKNLIKVTSKDITGPIPGIFPLEGVVDPIKKALETEEPYCLNQHKAAGEFEPGTPGVSDFFGLPLLAVLPIKTANKNLGIINIHAMKSPRCGEIDFNLLTILTAQVASAIYNCHLHEKIENYVTELNLTSKQLEKSKTTLEEQMFHLNTITLFSSQLHSTFLIDEIYEVIRDLMVNFLGIEIFHIIYIEDGNRNLYTGVADGVTLEVKNKLNVAKFHIVTEKVLRTGEPFFQPDFEKGCVDSLEKRDRNNPLACLPLMLDEKPRGAMVIESLLPQKTRFIKEDYELLSMLAQESAIALMTGYLYPKVQSKAKTDQNTGLYNHTHFQKCIDLEYLRARRYKTPLSFLLIDVDDFKKINAIHGFIIGDHILRDIAEILNITRSNLDALAQYGPEEFGALLPQTDLEGAKILAERIRGAIEKFEFKGKEGRINVTVSIGISSFPGQKTKEAMINVAETSLIEAKRAGKNRTMHCG